MRPHRLPAEDVQPPLLGIIEVAIKRLGGIREALQRGTAIAHGVRGIPKSLDRIGPLFRFPPLTALRHRLRLFLRKIAKSALDWRPVLFLIGIQTQAGMQCSNPCVDECSSILGRLARAALSMTALPCAALATHAIGRRRRLLRKSSGRQNNAGCDKTDRKLFEHCPGSFTAIVAVLQS
jgi:hypothetical protein